MKYIAIFTFENQHTACKQELRNEGDSVEALKEWAKKQFDYCKEQYSRRGEWIVCGVEIIEKVAEEWYADGFLS